MRRAWASMLVFVCAVVAPVPTSPATQDPSSAEAGVATGVRQVEEGDFEAAVATLQAATARLRGDPQRVRLLVQADIQLAVAHIALDQTPEAVRAFTEALALDPELRLPPERFSPKVLRAFETAREQTARRTATPGKPSSRRKAAIIGGGLVAAGAAAAIVVASRGSGTPTFTGARFGTPVLVCPDGSDNLALPFRILVQATNPGGDPVAITDVTSVVTIVDGTTPGEIGFASSQTTTATPASIPPRRDVTLQVESFLVCGNGPGDPGRFNEWSGRVTLNTTAGVFMFDVADRMRVNIP